MSPPAPRSGATGEPRYETVAGPGPWPDPARVHGIHDRYLLEVVEALNLCPFARRSREDGRVYRPLFGARAPVAPADVARVVDRILADAPDVEIILPTFVMGQEAWPTPEAFETMVRRVREAHHARHDPAAFYMVGFHPESRPDPARPLRPDNLVPLLRRSPDPVIQCVRCSVLDRVRQQARVHAATRLREEMQRLDPEVAALLARSVQTDSELGGDIARHNFETVGHEEGRARLEHTLDDIFRERDRAYRPRPD